MIRPHRFFLDRYRALVQRLRLFVFTHVVIKIGEVVKGRGKVSVVRLLPDGKRALVERLGLGVIALLAVHAGEVIQGAGEVIVLFP